jgi:galactokinase
MGWIRKHEASSIDGSGSSKDPDQNEPQRNVSRVNLHAILQPLLPSLCLAIQRTPTLFDTRRPCSLARAPGRLDVMGGIADYAGATVLERTLAEGTVCVAQVRDGDFHAMSAALDPTQPQREVILSRAELHALMTDQTARAAFFRAPENRWAAYILGAVFVLHSERFVPIPVGIGMLVASNVPEGRGVSSSAAAEVASLYAIAHAMGISLLPNDVAFLAQKMEHTLAKAPCGLMDQMAVVHGVDNHLMRIRCQPGSVEGSVGVPQDLCFWGIDSGVSHAVSGADYGTVRCATFMGYRILADVLGMSVTNAAHGIHIEDSQFNGFLANVSPSQLAKLADEIPELVKGGTFLQKYKGTTDAVTSVTPDLQYRVRASLTHAIVDSHRARLFAAILGTNDHASMPSLLGELMLQSHESYSSVGLGSAATEALVADIRILRDKGVYGGRITGGGSGGTVAVVAHREAAGEVQDLAARHSQRMMKPCLLFRGSSPGAEAFGAHSVQLNNGALEFTRP